MPIVSRSKSASSAFRSSISAEAFVRTSERTASRLAAMHTWSKSGAEIAKTNFSGAVIVNVRSRSRSIRTSSLAGTAAATAVNGISRTVTTCETTIHGGTMCRPAPTVFQ